MYAKLYFRRRQICISTYKNIYYLQNTFFIFWVNLLSENEKVADQIVSISLLILIICLALRIYNNNFLNDAGFLKYKTRC